MIRFISHFVSLSSFFFLVPGIVYSQVNVDSLIEVMEKTKGKEKVDQLVVISKEMSYYNPEEGEKYGNQGLELARKLKYRHGEADILFNLGVFAYYKGDLDQAIDNYEESLRLFTLEKDTARASRLYRTIGMVYQRSGSLDTAMIYYNKGLAIHMAMNDSVGIAACYGSIGIIYNQRGDLDSAVFYYTESLKIREKLGDLHGQANFLGNLGLVMQQKGKYDRALEYFDQAIAVHEKTGHARGIIEVNLSKVTLLHVTGELEDAKKLSFQCLEQATEMKDPNLVSASLNNLGIIYSKQEKTDSAIYFFKEQLDVETSVRNLYGIADAQASLGDVYLKNKNYTQALTYLKPAMKAAEQMGLMDKLWRGYRSLGEAYSATGKYKEAYESILLSMTFKDSVYVLETVEQQAEMETKFNTERKELQITNLEKDNAIAAQEKMIAEAEADKQRSQNQLFRFGLIGATVLILLFVFAFYIKLRDNKVIRAQKRQVEDQKEALEEKNQEILDSITYAKRIQTAILPPNKLVKEYLADSFILYKPKDIVAGDFYWMEPQKDRILFAAADCTGHGVPGAMVSVICNNGLNRSVREFGLTDPAKILDKTRELVITEFEKSEEEVKDGMDIALCLLGPSSASGTSLKYAGAHNPLWIIRKGATEMEEVKADKQPIGKYSESKPFNTHTVELNSGDTFYIFSDGFADQFGGEKGKKFKASNFKSLLISMQNETMDQQKDLLEGAFEKWRGHLEQVDDLCIIGVKV